MVSWRRVPPRPSPRRQLLPIEHDEAESSDDEDEEEEEEESEGDEDSGGEDYDQ